MQTGTFAGAGLARLRRHWMVPLLLAGLALSLSGLAGRAWSAIIRPISTHNDLFLAQSISDTLHLMVPVGIAKAAADVIEGSTIDVQAGAVLASAGMRIEAGDTLQPLLDYIDVAWKILMASLVWQIGARCLLRGAPMLGEPLVAVACACALASWLAGVCWPSVARLRQVPRRVAGMAGVGAAVLMIVLPLTIRFTSYLGERTTAPLRAEVTASFAHIGRVCSLRGLQDCSDIQEKARFLTAKMREIGAYAWEGTGEVAGAVAKLAVVKLLNGIVFPLLSLGFLVWLVRGMLLPRGGWGMSEGKAHE
jgi:hypothetical protein